MTTFDRLGGWLKASGDCYVVHLCSDDLTVRAALRREDRQAGNPFPKPSGTRSGQHSSLPLPPLKFHSLQRTDNQGKVIARRILASDAHLQVRGVRERDGTAGSSGRENSMSTRAPNRPSPPHDEDTSAQRRVPKEWRFAN
jgi:hypothetical protein